MTAKRKKPVQNAKPSGVNAKSNVKPQETGANKAARLLSLLAAHPELANKITEALETKRFFLTISFQKKVPGVPGDLQHYWMRRGYEINDVLPSLRHIEGDWIRKENPTAELTDGQAWH